MNARLISLAQGEQPMYALFKFVLFERCAGRTIQAQRRRFAFTQPQARDHCIHAIQARECIRFESQRAPLRFPTLALILSSFEQYAHRRSQQAPIAHIAQGEALITRRARHTTGIAAVEHAREPDSRAVIDINTTREEGECRTRPHLAGRRLD